MKTITMQKNVILQNKSGDGDSLATEQIILRRHDEASETFMSIECVNYEPDDEYNERMITISCKDVDTLCAKIKAFSNMVRDE